MKTNKLSRMLLCLSLAATPACTPLARWGDRAFYSPAHRGYVVSVEAPDDRPAPGAETIVLADPLDGGKLFCKEDVEPFLAAHAKARSDDVHRENVMVGSAIGFLPLTAIGAIGAYTAAMGLSYAEGPALLAVPDAHGRYLEGVEAFGKGRWGAARQKFELALAGDAKIGRGTKALFLLGRSYEKLGERDLAARSYLSFVRRSWVSAEAEYMRAEAYLEGQGAELPRCKSQGDLEVVWP